MIEVNALKTGRQPLFDRLNQHSLAFGQQVDRFGGGAEQTVREQDHFIGRADQAQQWPRAGDHIELRPAAFRNMLQLDDIRCQDRGNADDPLAPECQRYTNLLARDCKPADLEEGARKRTFRCNFGK